jgi:ppGpp synthetase/RelA/SpoT-type nucleotidyltranferase
MAPADRWQAIQEEYEREWEEWDALAQYVRTTLETALADGAIHGWVFARAKAPESYTRKLVIGGKEPDEIGDRAGVRVLLPYEADIDAVERLVRERFTLIRREQKRDALAYNEIGYLGVHLDVRLRDDDPQADRFAARPVEVQLRTLAQAAWAEVSHEQLYKPPADVPDELKRRIYRLVALVELFDSEVAAFVNDAAELPGYKEAVALTPLESELRRRFGVVAPADRRLSRELAAALVPLYEGVAPEQVYEQVLAPWLAGHEADVRAQLERGAQARHPLIQQPEVLLIFERLENAPSSLAGAWPESVPRALLVDLGQMWGVELPPEIE